MAATAIGAVLGARAAGGQAATSASVALAKPLSVDAPGVGPAAAAATPTQTQKQTLTLTLTDALSPSEEARVVTERVPPFRVCHVNAAWVRLCGFTETEVRGRTLAMIQGPGTDEAAVARLVSDCARGRVSSMEVTNYDKAGRPFLNQLEVLPLVEPNPPHSISHFLGILRPSALATARYA